MKAILAVLGILFACLLAVGFVTATPLVGEVVTLHTREAGGEWQSTPLWIVDLEDGSYLRAGQPAESGWLKRWSANGQARLERSGEVFDVTLVEAPSRFREVHAGMAEKYGWADDFIFLMRDVNDTLPLRAEVGSGGGNPR